METRHLLFLSDRKTARTFASWLFIFLSLLPSGISEFHMAEASRLESQKLSLTWLASTIVALAIGAFDAITETAFTRWAARD